MKLRYTDRAKDDVEIAFAWYERQRRGLGFEFLDCVESAVKSIIENPKMYRTDYLNFRGCMIRRFPFSVFYTVEESEIVVHSVFDNRQDPEKGHNNRIHSDGKKRCSFPALLFVAGDAKRWVSRLGILLVKKSSFLFGVVLWSS